jgi:hypothetical protein
VDRTDLVAEIRKQVSEADQPMALIQELRTVLHELSPNNNMPIDHVRWIPIEDVEPNDYNPNSVAQAEMGLLLISIDHDGYTQPVVTIYDAKKRKYTIIDGFHRYFVMRNNKQIRERTGGLLPCVVLEKDINERMAATVRHNRARGKHSVQGMSNMVFSMLDNGMRDEDICNELGLEPEELLRLKHITGFAKLFANRDYNRAWVTRSQIQIKQRFAQNHPGEEGDPTLPVASPNGATNGTGGH